jgi:hypothetical protein
MKFELLGNLKEAYYTADEDQPSFLVQGIVKGVGPVNVTVRGVALKLEGITIGQRYRVLVEELDD